MLQNWWKILSVVIIAGTLFGGLLAPIYPGIESVQPSRIDAGELIVMQIKGYNTHFARKNNLPRVWLKLDDEHALGATQVMAQNERQLRASFYVPKSFPDSQQVTSLSLVIDSEKDGTSVLPAALFVRHPVTGDQAELLLWKKDPIVHLNKRSFYGFPYRNILVETIRNTYFHIPMWFGMILLFAGSVFYSYRYMRSERIEDDMRAVSLIHVGILFGVMGLVTGMIWAQYTWGKFWSWDVKQNVSAITLLIYFALIILRSSFNDEERRARLSAGYNIFAFVLMIPLIFVVPRLTDSLHPGNGGNPALGGEDMDHTMRMIFYPAIIGWTLLGVWISQIIYRYFKVKERIIN